MIADQLRDIARSVARDEIRQSQATTVPKATIGAVTSTSPLLVRFNGAARPVPGVKRTVPVTVGDEVLLLRVGDTWLAIGVIQ